MSPAAAMVALVIHERVTGVLWLPARSRALTAKLWGPGERCAAVNGLVHGEVAVPSTEQTKLAPASESVNANDPFALESSKSPSR